MKVCKTCGHHNDDNFIYCEKCGLNLTSETKLNNTNTKKNITTKKEWYGKYLTIFILIFSILSFALTFAPWNTHGVYSYYSYSTSIIESVNYLINRYNESSLLNAINITAVISFSLLLIISFANIIFSVIGIAKKDDKKIAKKLFYLQAGLIIIIIDIFSFNGAGIFLYFTLFVASIVALINSFLKHKSEYKVNKSLVFKDVALLFSILAFNASLGPTTRVMLADGSVYYVDGLFMFVYFNTLNDFFLYYLPYVIFEILILINVLVLTKKSHLSAPILGYGLVFVSVYLLIIAYALGFGIISNFIVFIIFGLLYSSFDLIGYIKGIDSLNGTNK